MIDRRVECLIPAAGLGSRLAGVDTLPKPLTLLNGRPLLLRAIENALAVCSRCVVVTGFRGAEVVEVLGKRPGVTIVRNDHYQQGMITSIAAGLEEVSTPWCFIAPADMPFLSPAVYRALLAAIPRAEVAQPPQAAFPVLDGRRGHPVLVRTVLREQLAPWIQSHPTEPTMREFLRQFPLVDVPVDTADIFVDLDTPEQIAAALQRVAAT